MLDDKLREIQNNILGYQHTYFEPPDSVRISYDAIVYERTGFNVKRANNKGYLIRDEYQVMVISKDPETELPRAILEEFEMCSPGKSFVRDNLWHFPFTIYF
jgi:hypothetical protein